MNSVIDIGQGHVIENSNSLICERSLYVVTAGEIKLSLLRRQTLHITPWPPESTLWTPWESWPPGWEPLRYYGCVLYRQKHNTTYNNDKGNT